MSEPAGSMKHERSDAHVRGILWAIAGLIIFGVLVHLAIALFQYTLTRLDRFPSTSHRTAAAPREEVPPPRLQSSPAQDWQAYRAASEAHLHSYGWIDRQAGVIRLPIERAMELTVQRGLPARSISKTEDAR